MSSAAEVIKLVKQKAEKLLIAHKARTIARYLGTVKPKKHGSWWLYDDKRIAIEYDDYGNNLSIYYEGAHVLCVHIGELTKAILQETWIKHLDVIYEQADNNRKTIEEQVNAREKEEKWADHLPEAYNPNKIDDSDKKAVEEYCKDAPWTKDKKKRMTPPSMRLLLADTVDELRNNIKEHQLNGWLELHRNERTANTGTNSYLYLGYNYAVMEQVMEIK